MHYLFVVVIVVVGVDGVGVIVVVGVDGVGVVVVFQTIVLITFTALRCEIDQITFTLAFTTLRCIFEVLMLVL